MVDNYKQDIFDLFAGMGCSCLVKLCSRTTIACSSARAQPCSVPGENKNFNVLINMLISRCEQHCTKIPFQHDAACRVIARLKKERDEAYMLLAQAERQLPTISSIPQTSALSNGKRGLFLEYSLFTIIKPSIFEIVGISKHQFCHMNAPT